MVEVKVEIGTLLVAFGVIIGILATLLIQARCRLYRKNQSNDGDDSNSTGTSTVLREGGSQNGDKTDKDEAEQVADQETTTGTGDLERGIAAAFEDSTNLSHHSNNSEVEYEDDGHLHCPQNLLGAKARRERLPDIIIFVRHGESQGNADHTLYRTKPDNLVDLTDKGMKQAHKAGKRVEKLFHMMDLAKHEKIKKETGVTPKQQDAVAVKRLHLVVSPFERTRQTAAAMRRWFAHRVVRTDLEPRIREQEFANLQGTNFGDLRQEQKRVGRFWYRFPTGESGSDVYDRVKSWWTDSVLNVNERYGYEPVDGMVVVTHGLTMRFVLMQLYGWSPTTFHSVWNADNCNLYVLRKDLSVPGPSPYRLDEEAGDAPKSSIDLKVEFEGGYSQNYKLRDYLKIPPPRTQHLDEVKSKLAEQYPEVNKDRINSVMFLPFIEGAVAEERTRSGRRASLGAFEMVGRKKEQQTLDESTRTRQKRFQHANSVDLGGFCPHPELYATQEKGWQY